MYQFEPVIPYSETVGVTRIWTARIAGQHQTAVATLDSNFSPRPAGCGSLCFIGEVGRAIAEQLLRSPAWGNVPVTDVSPMNAEDPFRGAVENVWLQDYSAMLNDSPVGFSWLLPCHDSRSVPVRPVGRASTPGWFTGRPIDMNRTVIGAASSRTTTTPISSGGCCPT